MNMIMAPKNTPSQMRLWTRIETWAKLLFRRDTPLKVKAILGFAILYLLSPFDLVPDWIIGLGFLDDFTVVSLLVAWALKIADKQNK